MVQLAPGVNALLDPVSGFVTGELETVLPAAKLLRPPDVLQNTTNVSG